MKKTMITALMTSAILGSCSTGNKYNTALQENLPGRWNIVEVDGQSTKGTENQPFINFTDSGTVNGNMSINLFFGTYTLKGDSISFGNMGMTQMAGINMDVEFAVRTAMEKCATLDMQDSIINAKDMDGNIVMKLKRD